FLDVVHIGQYKRGCAIDALCKDIENNESRKQDKGEFGFRSIAGPPARLEDNAEHNGVDRKHEYRVEKRPQNAHERAPVATDDFTLDQCIDQAAIAPEARNHFFRRYGKLLHQSNNSVCCSVPALASLLESTGSAWVGHWIASAGSFHTIDRSCSGA